MADRSLLPHLAAVCKQARVAADVGAAKVAGEADFGASTSISRTFEGAVAWPRDPDAVVAAYAETTGVPLFDLWQEAIDRARKAPAAETVLPTEPGASAKRTADQEGDRVEAGIEQGLVDATRKAQTTGRRSAKRGRGSGKK